MSFSAILEVVLGLILIYYVLGLMVSAVTSFITKGLEIRANQLEKYLYEMLGDETKLAEILKNPLVTAIKPLGLVPVVGLFTGQTKEYKAGKIPAATFIHSLFGQALNANMTLEEIDKVVTEATKSLPENSKLKKDLDDLIDKAKKSVISTQVRSQELVKEIETWFDDMMVKAGATFTAQARRIVIVLALVVTLLTGVDSIDITKQLWDQPNLRAVAAAKAVEVADKELTEDIASLISTLDELQLEYHNDWWNTQNTTESPNAILLKGLGLLITWVAVAQGSSFWYDVMKKVTNITQATSPSTTQEPTDG